MANSAALILTHAHMDHVRYASSFAKTGVLKNPGFTGYKKIPYVHCYSSGNNALYVDCGDALPRNLGKNGNKAFPAPTFEPHMKISNVIMGEATAKWLEIESHYHNFFNFSDIPNVAIAPVSRPFKFKGYKIRFFPSKHAFGSVFPVFKDEKRDLQVAHLVDADHGEYSRLAYKIRKGAHFSNLAQAVINSDFVCLDCSHVFSNYPNDSASYSAYSEGIKRFKNGEYDHVVFSFFSPLNSFKHLIRIGKQFSVKERKEIILIFPDNLTHELFEAFTMQGAYAGNKDFEGLLPKPLVENLRSFNYSMVRSFRSIPPRSLIFTSDRKRAKILENLKRTFRVVSKFRSFRLRKDYVDLVARNHPDRDEILRLINNLIMYGKKGQTIILNAPEGFRLSRIEKLERFKAILEKSKRPEYDKKICSVTRSQPIEYYE
ncbi:MAG: hypothetical protein ABIF92_00375 [archaeon]